MEQKLNGNDKVSIDGIKEFDLSVVFGALKGKRKMSGQEFKDFVREGGNQQPISLIPIHFIHKFNICTNLDFSMAYILVKHKVKDYEQFKKVFFENFKAVKNNGS